MSKTKKIKKVIPATDRYYVGINQEVAKDYDYYDTSDNEDSDSLNYKEVRYDTNIDPYIFTNPAKVRAYDRTDVIYCEKNLLKGETAAWLVHVIYSSGHTFGREINGYYSLVALFPLGKLNEARELRDYLETVDKLGTTYFTTSSGRKIEVYPAWCGYFDTLEEVRIEKVNINDELAYIL